MPTEQSRPKRTAFAPRVLALCMAGWLCVIPQVICSSQLMAWCEEYGTSVPPLIEEEEVHHKDVPPRHAMVIRHGLADLVPQLPHWEELLLHTLHGEVPHPPPWA